MLTLKVNILTPTPDAVVRESGRTPTKKKPHLVFKISDFCEIRPSLTTSEEGLKTSNIHLETRRI